MEEEISRFDSLRRDGDQSEEGRIRQLQRSRSPRSISPGGRVLLREHSFQPEESEEMIDLEESMEIGGRDTESRRFPMIRTASQRTRPQSRTSFLYRMFGQLMRHGRGGSGEGDDDFGDSSSEDDDATQIRVHQIPPEWDDIDEDSETGNEIMDNFGAFGLLLYTRIKRLKILDLEGTNQAFTFLRLVLDFYSNHMSKIHKSHDSLCNISQLVSILPEPTSLINILNMAKRSDPKEMLIYKIAIDVYESYYKNFESPSFKIYQKEVIPLALKYYSILSANVIIKINDHIKNLIQKIPKLSKFVHFYSTNNEYIRYYAKEAKDYQQLTAGNSSALFYA